jgi:hypothetical protein
MTRFLTANINNNKIKEANACGQRMFQAMPEKNPR